MKKNKMMRAASVMLIAVLMTTSVISGTFAKYVTSDNAGDDARVAKWGVTVEATGDEVFAKKYDNEADENGTKVVSNVEVVAPGTEGKLGGIKITGMPEVMVDIEVTATLTLEGWNITGDWDNDPNTVDSTIFYCPLVFTIGGTEIKGADYQDNLAGLKSAVEGKLTSLAADDVPVGTDLGVNRDVTIEWSWPYNGKDDVKDTALGDLAANATAPTIKFECEAKVTQVD